jgi:hypothetical protein
LTKDVHLKAQSLDDLTDDQLLHKLAVLTEMAKPLLARLPAVIDAAPVRAGVGAETNTEGEIVYYQVPSMPAWRMMFRHTT